MPEAPKAEFDSKDSDIQLIKHYFDTVATSTDPEELISIEGTCDSIFHTDSPWIKSIDDCPRRVAYELQTGGDLVRAERIQAICLVVRTMIQGNKQFPADRFGEVIEMAVESIQKIEPPVSKKTALKWLRHEIVDVWEPFELQTDDEFSRAQEAHKLVSGATRHQITKVGMTCLQGVVRAVYPSQQPECS